MLSSPPPSHRSTAIRRLVATAALALGLVGVGASAASAHSGLLSTDPADGANLPIAPAQVVLTFNEPPQPIGTQVQVLDPNGETIASGPPTVTGTRITQPLREARPAGTYTVQWRMTSADGHPLSGQYTFTAASGVGATGQAPAPTPSRSVAHTPPSPSPQPFATQAADAGEDAAGWRWGAGWIAALTVGAITASLLVLVLILRRRGFKDGPSA